MGRVIAVSVTVAIVPFVDRLLCDAEGLPKKWRWFSTGLKAARIFGVVVTRL